MKRTISLFVAVFILLSLVTPAYAVSSDSVDEAGEYAYMAGRYLHTSGVGGWGLEVQIQPNGCFTGNYSNTEYGMRSDNYPNGTVYLCGFSGRLSDLKKVNDYTFSAQISEHTYADTPGEEKIIDGVRYVNAAVGLGKVGDTVLIYTPGAPVAQLPEDFVQWIEMPNGKITTANLGHYGLYTDEDLYSGRKGFYQIETYTGEDPKNIVSCRTVSFGNGIDVDLNWGWGLFDKNASEYDHSLALAALYLCRGTYSSKTEVESRLSTLGLCDLGVESVYYPYAYQFSPGTTFGCSKIMLNGNVKYLFTIVIRGTNNWREFIATDIPSITNGFIPCRDNVYGKFLDYLEDLQETHQITLAKDNTIFFITGHSLGAATAGLLSDTMLQYAEAENIFTYTFASPNYDTKNNDYASYKNVHNILSTNDEVRNFPWGYKRYGNDWYYDYQDYGATSIEIFSKYIGKDEDAHATETYLACLLSGLPKNMGDGVANPYSLSSIHCPVDIIVYNSDGVEMGRTEGGEVILSEDTEVIIYLDGDSKYVMASVDKEYSIQFTVTGSGTMTYSQAIVNSYTGEFIEVKEFCNVELYDGKRMSAKFGGETEINEVGLYVQNEYGETIAQIGVDGQEAAVEISENDDEPTTQDNLFRKTVVVVIGAGALLLIISAVLVTMLKRKNRGS